MYISKRHIPWTQWVCLVFGFSSSLVSEEIVVTVQRPSKRLHRLRFFHPLNRTEHGSAPSLTTRDRELIFVLDSRIEPGDLTRDLRVCDPSL